MASRFIDKKALASLILPIVIIIYGAINFYAGDVVSGSVLIGLGLLFYVMSKSVFKEKNKQSDTNTQTIQNNQQPVSASVEQRKAICPHCRSLIPVEADTCPICGTKFLN